MTMVLNIDAQKVVDLSKKSLTLDHVYFLKMLEKEEDISLLRSNLRLDLVFKSLIRKGYIDEDGKILPHGKEILEFINGKKTKKVLEKKKMSSMDFDKFWLNFPATNGFSYRGKSFKSVRALRINKEKCKEKLSSILNEREYTLDEIIGAIKIDVLNKKEESIRTGENKLSYMNNSLTYLNQRVYEPFIEEYRERIKNGQQDESSAPVGNVIDI